MPQGRKPRIGLLGLMLQLYDQALPELKRTQEQFARVVAKSLSRCGKICFPGICNTCEQVEAAVARFERDEADVIFVLFLSYAPSWIALPALQRTRLPIVIANTQKARTIGQASSPRDMLESHGMHGVQDLANVLIRAGVRFHIVTGYYEDERFLAELGEWARAAQVATELRQARVGVMGGPFEGMGDFGLDTTALLAQVGTTVVEVPLAHVANLAHQAPQKVVTHMIAEDRARFAVDAKLDQATHAISARLEWAMREAAREQNLDALAMNFLSVANDGRLATVPFLAASEMMADGFGYGGEADAASAVAVLTAQRLAPPASFTEMFTMDFEAGDVFMSHMGEANWHMARKDEPVRLIRKKFRFGKCADPAVLCFALAPGPCTLLNLTVTRGGRLKLIVAEGEIANFPFVPTFDVPHYKFKPDKPLESFLTRYSMEGGSHHLAIMFGHRRDLVAKVGDLLGIEFAHV